MLGLAILLLGAEETNAIGHVYVGNGQGLPIYHTGFSSFPLSQTHVLSKKYSSCS